MLNLQIGSEEGKMSNIHGTKFSAGLFTLRKGSVVSRFTFHIKQNTLVKVYHELVNSSTGSSF